MGDRPSELDLVLGAAREVLEPSDPDPQALSEAVDRALAAGVRTWKEHARILDRVAAVEREGGPQRALFAAYNQSSLSQSELTLVLIELAKRDRSRDPDACRLWADAAVRAAEQHWQIPGYRSFRARAWAEKGNAERIADDFGAARNSFDRALALLEEDGGGDASFRGEVFSLLASLEYAQHRPEEALACLEVAERCFRRAHQDLDRRKVILKRANVRLYIGDFSRALDDFKTVLSALLADREPRTGVEQVLTACHDVLGAVTEIALTTKNAEEQQQTVTGFLAVLPDLLSLYHQAPAGWRARLIWIMGRMFLAEGRLPAARRLLESALAGFLRHEKPATAAVVALDLALVLAQCKAFPRVREVALAACTVFQTAGLEADTWAAHRALLDCEVAAIEPTIVAGLKKLRGASLRRTPNPR